MPALPPTRVLVAATAIAAMGLYSLFLGTKSRLIDAPETVARRVDPKASDDEKGGDPEYDVVIIGGGTAGCVIASRLSENKDVRVLVLEAGRSSRDIMECNVPAAYAKTMHTDDDFELWTEPQADAADTKKYWPRAKLLGGCSAINAMMFHTCAPTDYDEWALSGQDGASSWAYKEFVKYFLKFEKFIPHSKFPKVDASVRGNKGPVQVGYFGHLHPTSTKWMDACVKLGIPHNPDINGPAGTLGVTKIMTYIDPDGRRVTTERAYLTPDVLKRPNLKVAIQSHVTRILFETNGDTKKAVGVEFVKQKGGPRYRVRAKRQIVLSAGSIHSPHILMLSGVGPKDHILDHGIPLVHELPGVGQNMQDHAAIGINMRVKKGHSLSYLIAGVNPKFNIDTAKAITALLRWKLFGTGPMTTNPSEAAAFVRSDDAKLFPPDHDAYNIKDMSSGPNAPDLETIVLTAGYSEHGHGPLPPGDIISMIIVALRPQSTGTITLKSSDSFDAPAIDPKYLSSQNDVACLVRGLRLLLRTAKAEPLASIIVHDDDPALDHNMDRLSDAELEVLVRKRVETLYHPTSTCRMAKLEDGGVVDPYLRVYGIENLRVVDASIFPRVPAGHTTAPSIAVGEKAADIIKESLSSS